MLVKVWTELPSGRMTGLIAKVVSEEGPDMTIQYLSKTDELDHGCAVYRYEDQTYVVQDDSILEYFGTDDENEIGYKPVPDGFVKYDSDSDYVPSESEDEETPEEEYSDEESDYYVEEE